MTSDISTATALWEEGRLADAIAAAEAALRAQPLDDAVRRFLAELLCFAGELDRADRLLDVLLARTPPPGPALLRTLIAGERRRRAVEEGTAGPALPHGQAGAAGRALQAHGLLRDGRTEEASALLRADAEAPRPGSADGVSFAHFRDQDDVFVATFELLTLGGELVWLDMDRVARLSLPRPEIARDLLWRPVEVGLVGGPSLPGFMPTLYPGSHRAADPLRLGHATDFRDEGPVVRGIGLRVFELDEEVRSVLDPGELRLGG
jgi:type VI secretion system protein ImpE